MLFKKAILAVSFILFSQNIFAAATCVDGSAKVLVGEYNQMAFSGLDEKGVPSGKYTCSVVSVSPGFFAAQSQLKCQLNKNSDIVVMAWMVEGLDMFGRQAASAALYNPANGDKVFEAGCSKIY